MMRAKDFRRMARYALRGKWKRGVLAGFLAWLLGGQIAAAGGGGSAFSREKEYDSEVMVDFFQSDLWQVLLPILVVTIVVMLLWWVVTVVISGAASLGYARFNLHLVDGRDARISDLVSQFHRLGDGFLLKLLTGLYLFLWTLLIIPGFIKTYSYAMTTYILSENPGMRPNDAITASRRLMNGNKWRLFCLEMSFIGWWLLCFASVLVVIGIVCAAAILLGMPLLVLVLIPLALPMTLGFWILLPYMEAARAAFYRGICREAAGTISESGQEE